MTTAFDKLAFETAQAARIGWFFGQKLLAARLAKPVPAPPELRGRTMPDRRRLVADLWRLIEEDWRNIEAGIYVAPEDWRGRPAGELRRGAAFLPQLRAGGGRPPRRCRFPTRSSTSSLASICSTSCRRPCAAPSLPRSGGY